MLALILLSIGVASAASVRLAVTAASVDTSVCPANPTPVRNFSTTSTAAFLYYVLDNVAAGDTVSVSWLDPTGKVYAPAGGFVQRAKQRCQGKVEMSPSQQSRNVPFRPGA